MLLLNFSPEKSSNLAYASMVGSGLVNLILVTPLRHPTLNKPLLDYNLMLTMLPSLIVGTVFGDVFYYFLPELFGIIIMLLILLVASFYEL